MGESDKPSRHIEAAGAAVGAVTGTAIGGPAGGVIGAAVTPYLVDLVGQSWGELRGRKEWNATQVIAQAASYADVSPETLLTMAADDPARGRLLDVSLQAGAALADEEKIAGLARCLANGIQDAARVDQEVLIVRALTDLDPIHVRVLADMHGRSRSQRDIHRFMMGDVSVTEFMNADDLSGAVLAVLERHGLVSVNERVTPDRGGIHSRGPEVKITYPVTEFGKLCLERLGHPVTRRQRFGETT
ncbi:hypothetical protein OH802_22810 [Nocardioides sp. NBC_00850]|uniref:hypothetical protein n=1 Tax=Nocardioides sp. NBC_00850 TaxID=2976001 RepID=UPI00386D58A4|nr:hypothetical protein OH802_22810 [Nocardioides sp. NBC_00850]